MVKVVRLPHRHPGPRAQRKAARTEPPDERALRAVFGAAVNRINSPPAPITLPPLSWAQRMDEKYGELL